MSSQATVANEKHLICSLLGSTNFFFKAALSIDNKFLNYPLKTSASTQMTGPEEKGPPHHTQILYYINFTLNGIGATICDWFSVTFSWYWGKKAYGGNIVRIIRDTTKTMVHAYSWIPYGNHFKIYGVAEPLRFR